jgi:hypothetical protein
VFLKQDRLHLASEIVIHFQNPYHNDSVKLIRDIFLWTLSTVKPSFYIRTYIEIREMLAQIQEQRSDQSKKIKLSQILKNATERQCFGQFMKF